MIKVVYNEKQVADPGKQPLENKGYTPSPSARKPLELAVALRLFRGVEFIEPLPLNIDDLKLCHDAKYVDDVMNLKTENGFGTISQSVVDSLPYTNGAMYTAAKVATKANPACALVSGFHHACYEGWKGHGWFCTFNGLMIAAMKLLAEGYERICIIDADMHHGNGTDDILDKLPHLREKIIHFSLGDWFDMPEDADDYMDCFLPGHTVDQYLGSNVKNTSSDKIQVLRPFAKPDLIIYQAGADVHIDDPYGGILNTDQIYERDRRMFSLAKDAGIPIAWNLAGGYQTDENGSIQKVLDLHLNTFKACEEVYGMN